MYLSKSQSNILNNTHLLFICVINYAIIFNLIILISNDCGQLFKISNLNVEKIKVNIFFMYIC